MRTLLLITALALTAQPGAAQLNESQSSVLSAVENIPTAAFQIGELLIVKTLDANGAPTIVVRTMTNEEMLFLDGNEGLLRTPAALLDRLDELKTNHSEMSEVEVPPPQITRAMKLPPLADAGS